MPQPLMPKKPKLTGSVKIYKTCKTDSKKKKSLFHHRGLVYKFGSEEIPEVTDKFDFELLNEAG